MIHLCVKNLEGVWFGVACDERKVFATAFAFDRSRALRDLLEGAPFDKPFQRSDDALNLAERTIALLKDVYDGKGIVERPVLALEHLSNYARNVIKAVSAVPLGYATSYGSVAKVVGGSPRAVGRVMALNPFPLIVPCHRVVRSNFNLGGYRYGLNVKLSILSRERRNCLVKREIDVDGKKLQVFPIEFVLSKRERVNVNMRR